jgi:2-hydroxy-6-oxonona-2,4-dienedioate hydrolase/2-hydroxy-6-oxo-6-(2'-carboxyphenyl)-hexa-2,4-dienoate hydrolase
MTRHLTLDSSPPARSHDKWPSIAALLVGTQTRLVVGKQSTHRVFEIGDGEPLFLVHGIGGHGETFARNWHALARHFHVYAIDARFHGLSSKDGWTDEGWLDTMVDGLADLVTTLGYKSAHIEGESLGAQVALRFGMRYPSLARKLVLNTGGFIRTAKTDFIKPSSGTNELMDLSRQSILEPTEQNVRKRLNWLVAKPDRMTDDMAQVRTALYTRPEVRESMKRLYWIDKPELATRPPGFIHYSDEDVRSLKPPTLVFWTQHNPGQGPDYGEYLADHIPGSLYYCMADAGHWPQWEHPEEHDAVITQFLRS